MEKETEKVKSYNFQILGDKEVADNVVKFPALREPGQAQKMKELFHQEKLAKKEELEIFPFIREQKERKEILNKASEEKFQQEVEKRLKKYEKEVFDKAYAEGLKLAKEELEGDFQKEAREKIEVLSNVLKNALDLKDEIFKNQKDQILFFIKSLTKWVILRELKDDGRYLETLLEKLFAEIQTQQNFIVQVGQKDFEKMPEIMKILQEKLGELKNTRVIIDYDLPENGVIIDSENGMIKSTLDGQFAVLDGLFGKVLPSDEELSDGKDGK